MSSEESATPRGQCDYESRSGRVKNARSGGGTTQRRVEDGQLLSSYELRERGGRTSGLAPRESQWWHGVSGKHLVGLMVTTDQQHPHQHQDNPAVHVDQQHPNDSAEQ